MKKLAILILLSACIFPPVYANHYAIVIDTGSSGSRLHLFEYAEEKNLPIIKEIFSEDHKPGLSSYASKPAEAGESLKPLFDDVNKFLALHHIDPNTVSLDILATAGMRLLSDSDQKNIYSDVKNFIQKNYSFSTHSIKTITGQMEGVYGWLDVNYLAENFQNHTKTMGIIDMGGASTQIAFQMYTSSGSPDEIHLTINQEQYILFSKSFLGLGQDEALRSVNTENAATNCYPVNYVLPTGNLGNFSFANCQTLYSSVIQHHQVSNNMLPGPDQHFIAYSGAFFDFQFLDVDKTPNHDLIEKRIQSVCTKSWDELIRDYPTISVKYLSTNCANNVYLDELFFHYYRLKDNQLSVSNQIHEKEIDWALGALIFELISKG